MLFKKYCISCHGIKGDLGINGAFNLTTSQLKKEEKIRVITEGRKNMPPFKGLLNENEIKALAEYTIKFKKQ
jgi:mono/diheme cytochrome c family protein